MDSKFDEYVVSAIDNIPSHYQDKIKDVVFKTETEPSPKQRKELGLRPCDGLFGLYEGVPLTKRNGAVYSIVPDVITIFQHPMTEIFINENELKEQIYETVWHEVAHYFGLDHEDIDRAKK